MTDRVMKRFQAGVPDALVRVLEAASAVESAATGSQRRTAFRATRSLLAGARMLGYSTVELAKVMNVKTNTVRSRAAMDGPVSTEYFCELAQIEPAQVAEWEASGKLGSASVDLDGQPIHLASDLLRLLLSARD